MHTPPSVRPLSLRPLLESVKSRPERRPLLRKHMTLCWSSPGLHRYSPAARHCILLFACKAAPRCLPWSFDMMRGSLFIQEEPNAFCISLCDSAMHLKTSSVSSLSQAAMLAQRPCLPCAHSAAGCGTQKPLPALLSRAECHDAPILPLLRQRWRLR